MTVRHRKQRLIECLKELRLPTVRTTYGELAAHARQESLSYEEFLLEVMERERETRRQHRVERALRVSKLPLVRRQASFPASDNHFSRSTPLVFVPLR